MVRVSRTMLAIMRRTGAILFFVFALSCCQLFAQTPAAQQKAYVIRRVIEMNHYSPRPVDDSFSANLFKKIINSADPKRLLFTAAEYKSLAAYSLKLDDELKGNGWNFLNLFTTLYKKALLRADSLVNIVSQKPLDFNLDESITMSRDGGFNFAATNADLVIRWTRYFKLNVLENAYDKIRSDTTGYVYSVKAIIKEEPAIKDKIKTAERKELKALLDSPEELERSLTELYLNGIAVSFDPHTNYFSPEGKQEFQSSLSSESLSFGIEFEENDKGRIEVDHLVPGGPAWKSGELHKGDELLQLYWENKEQAAIMDLSLEEVYKMLESVTQDRLVLKIKKANGLIKTVTLRKERISNDENIVKSFVLKGEKKIGYILLPGFYTEWENETGSGCANDVAKEIIKLKRDKIDGLIIDVRFNGGGSIQEGLEMTGIFVDDGPLAAQKNAKGKVIYYRDPNRGVIYDGPLVLMINGQSASASEMLAASLQDYNRAVIVGSTTYGKASVQRLFPLDTTYSERSDPPSPDGKSDVLKITFAKFYRLSGSSTQLKGIVPDVVLPDVFEGLDIGERFSPNALRPDTVPKNNFYKPLAPLPLRELAGKSAQRVSSDPDFQNIKKFTEAQVKENRSKQRVIPLKWDSFGNWMRQQEKDSDIIEGEMTTGDKKFEAGNNEHDKQWLQHNEYEKEINAVWLENIAEDIYVREAYLVICDLINLLKPPSKN